MGRWVIGLGVIQIIRVHEEMQVAAAVALVNDVNLAIQVDEAIGAVQILAVDWVIIADERHVARVVCQVGRVWVHLNYVVIEHGARGRRRRC